MRSRHFISSPYFYFSFINLFFLFIDSSSLFAVQDSTANAAEQGISFGDVFEWILVFGYLAGVFVLLPWVVYTNLKEGLGTADAGSIGDAAPDAGLTEEQRNSRALSILEKIEEKLTPFEEDGQQFSTITKGSQARFIKHGIDYITQNLQPADSGIIERINEIVEMYSERTKRVFTGSKWVIGCAIALPAFMWYTTGFNNFIIIQTLGLVFYFLSSRTPMYILEKRIERFGSFGGVFIGSLFSGLFIGAGTKHYKVYSDGRKERDHESELTGGMVFFLIIFLAAMILGFMVAALGVVNFLMNYMNNALIPAKPEAWYEKTFAAN